MEGGLKNKNFLFRNYGEKVILKSAIKLTSHHTQELWCTWELKSWHHVDEWQEWDLWWRKLVVGSSPSTHSKRFLWRLNTPHQGANYSKHNFSFVDTFQQNKPTPLVLPLSSFSLFVSMWAYAYLTHVNHSVLSGPWGDKATYKN